MRHFEYVVPDGGIYVGVTGDIIDTRSRTVIGFLPALRQTRKMLELDWRRGRPVRTTTRSGLGYVVRS